MNDNRLRKLDPRVKLVMMIVMSTLALLSEDLLFLSLLICVIILILNRGGAKWECVWGRVKVIFIMILSLFIIQCVFRRSGDVLFAIGDFPLIFSEGVWLAAMLSLRLIVFIMAAQILLEADVRDYLLALVQMKIPYEIAFMVMTGIHFIPILREEALNVYYSVQLRGMELKKTSLGKKIACYRRICIPILVGAMHRAKDMSIAMEARGLRAYDNRTYMRKLTLSKGDVAWLIIFPVAFIGLYIAWNTVSLGGLI